MKSAVLHKVGGPFAIEEVELLPPRKGEVRVKLKAAGLCHSDWHFVQGLLERPFPVILGHEGAGVIEEVGEGVTTLRKGQRVALNWAPACRHCYYCLRGEAGLCETFWPWRNGTMPDGSTRFRIAGEPARQFSVLSTFTEQTIAPVESCVPSRTISPSTWLRWSAAASPPASAPRSTPSTSDRETAWPYMAAAAWDSTSCRAPG